LRKDALLKTVIYRIISLILEASIIYLWTRSILAMGVLTLILAVASSLWYYTFDALWPDEHEKTISQLRLALRSYEDTVNVFLRKYR
jgi:uncharacterized membrane protein